jgi:hypothetical protein
MMFPHTVASPLDTVSGCFGHRLALFRQGRSKAASAGGDHTVITFAQGLEHLAELEKAVGSIAPTPEVR